MWCQDMDRCFTISLGLCVPKICVKLNIHLVDNSISFHFSCYFIYSIFRRIARLQHGLKGPTIQVLMTDSGKHIPLMLCSMQSGRRWGNGSNIKGTLMVLHYCEKCFTVSWNNSWRSNILCCCRFRNGKRNFQAELCQAVPQAFSEIVD